MRKERLPRKIKKELKKIILRTIDPAWKSKHLTITSFKKNVLYAQKRPTYKGITVTGYSLN